MFAMFDDEKEREDKDDLDVEPEEVEDLDTPEKEAEDVEGGMPRDPRYPLTVITYRNCPQ